MSSPTSYNPVSTGFPKLLSVMGGPARHTPQPIKRLPVNEAFLGSCQPDTAGGHPIGVIIKEKATVFYAKPVRHTHNAIPQQMKVNVFYRHVRCRNIEQRRKGRAFQHGPLLPNQGQRLIDNNGVGFGRLCIDSGCKMNDVSGTAFATASVRLAVPSGCTTISSARAAAQHKSSASRNSSPIIFFIALFSPVVWFGK